jgi:hypothetical protein
MTIAAAGTPPEIWLAFVESLVFVSLEPARFNAREVAGRLV